MFGLALTRSRVSVVTTALPFLVLGVVAVFLFGISWVALLGGVVLAVLSLVIAPLLLVPPSPLAKYLAHPDTARPANAVLNLTSAALIELARLGVVMFLNAQPRDAAWLGLGAHIPIMVIAVGTFGMAAFLGSSLPSQEDARPRGAASYLRESFGYGRNILVDAALTLLLVWSPWLAFVTVPAGAVWHALLDSKRPR
ncbi:hypothetical protein [Nonomuraea endophytica]|uniref:hypothetical protein n=1 Tax=Nonomuraea endophytica TaxID=714136 RepID=UPI0037C662B8